MLTHLRTKTNNILNYSWSKEIESKKKWDEEIIKKTSLSYIVLSSFGMFKGKESISLTYPQLGNKSRYPILFPVCSCLQKLFVKRQKNLWNCSKNIIEAFDYANELGEMYGADFLHSLRWFRKNETKTLTFQMIIHYKIKQRDSFYQCFHHNQN